MRHPLCAQCVYWVADHTAATATAGHCHRYPPGVYINPEMGVVVQKYPMTDHHQWCGEWSGDAEALAAKARLALAQAVKG